MRYKYGALIAFVIMALAISVAVSRNGRISDENLLKMCNGTNATIKESNDRIPAHKADTEGLIRFLEGARTARRAAYRHDHKASDLAAVVSYTDTIDFVKKNVRFDKVEPLDCRKIVRG